jgi:C4-dicarboxylate transporter DctM subunit
MNALVLFSTVAICFALGVPIAFSLGVASLVAIIFAGDLPLMLIAQKLQASNNSFPFLAIPLFTFAGGILLEGGLSRRLVELASFITWKLRIPGGLAVVAVLGSMLFGAISGSPSATVAAVGSILIPNMVAKGYPPSFCGAVQAAAGPLGSMIPPSIGLIVFGVCMNQSISRLFMATVIPGLLMGGILMVVCALLVQKKGLARAYADPGKTGFQIFREAIWALLMPIIILGGIYGGVFTPTEAAGVSVIYGYIAGFFLYRELTFAKLWKATVDAAISTAVVMVIIDFSSLFSWLVASYQIPQLISSLVLELTTNPIAILVIINVVLLILGCFVETSPAIIIVAPIFWPLVQQIGIDPIHYGIIVVSNLLIGLVTPPVGLCLFMASRVSKVPVDDIIKEVWIPLAAIIVCLIPINVFPQLSLWLLQFMN